MFTKSHFIGMCKNNSKPTRTFQDIEDIRSHYNVEDFIYYNHHKRDEHGHLHHFALNPVFKHYCKHFLKEILRQGHNTCLYYPLYPPYVEKEVRTNNWFHDTIPLSEEHLIR